LLNRTAVANEGKIHLGYMYAGDATLSTARIMMTGALAFAPFFERHLDMAAESLTTSVPATYVVHRDSQHPPEAIEAYMGLVHDNVREMASGRESAYFGADLGASPRRWSNREREEQFEPRAALAAFDTPEIAVNPTQLADAVRRRIAD
jgi:hypothetical protein